METCNHLRNSLSLQSEFGDSLVLPEQSQYRSHYCGHSSHVKVVLDSGNDQSYSRSGNKVVPSVILLPNSSGCRDGEGPRRRDGHGERSELEIVAEESSWGEVTDSDAVSGSDVESRVWNHGDGGVLGSTKHFLERPFVQRLVEELRSPRLPFVCHQCVDPEEFGWGLPEVIQGRSYSDAGMFWAQVVLFCDLLVLQASFHDLENQSKSIKLPETTTFFCHSRKSPGVSPLIAKL